MKISRYESFAVSLKKNHEIKMHKKISFFLKTKLDDVGFQGKYNLQFKNFP